MHGLINRSIQAFLRTTYGPELWLGVATAAGVDGDGFEPMLHYPDDVTSSLLGAAEKRLGRNRAEILDDLGLYLVSIEPVRRLLRFGGADFAEFLLSLEELPDRARAAVSELRFPPIRVDPVSALLTRLEVAGPPGHAHVLSGVLRAMADDYGALALIDHEISDLSTTLSVSLLDPDYAQGRSFRLTHPAA